MVKEALLFYAARREAFLAQIVEVLSADPRFVAGWLTGSFGRNEQDVLSDIDLTLVVADGYGDSLCARPWQVGGQTTSERYQLFCQFGEPAVIHENHNNAPAGGTFTFVLYAESAVMVDWTLRPESESQRPMDSLLLWDRCGIPVEASLGIGTLAERAQEASEMLAFFWMMAAVTAKYLIRGDGLFVNQWLETLTKLVYEVERRIAGEPWRYQRGSFTRLEATGEGQLRALRALSQQMLVQMPAVVQMGGYVPPAPMVTLEILLGLAQSSITSTE
jgi:hypothetical protein